MPDTEWVGVELLAINGVTFSEPMVSASGARAAVCDAVAAERARIMAEVKALPTLVLPTGTYVDVESVFEAIEP